MGTKIKNRPVHIFYKYLLVSLLCFFLAVPESFVAMAQTPPVDNYSVTGPEPVEYTPPAAAENPEATQQNNNQEPAVVTAENPPAQQQSPVLTSQVAEEQAKGIKISKERISLDLKGIDVNDLFRILALKMGLTIVSSKSVAGRVTIYLNNLTFDDALDVILLSQDLACDRKGSIINIMTSAEYEKIYGKKFNEKRQFKTIKLTYAKPSTVFNAVSQIKSDIGKVIADEASGTFLIIDIPEKVELIENTIKQLDQPLETEIFDVNYAKAADLKTHLTSAITAGSGEMFIDERSSKLVISDLPDKMKKLRRMVKAFDEPSQQVFIEAEILQVQLNKEYQREINWEKIMQEAKYHGLNYLGTFPVSPSFTPSPGFDKASYKMSIGSLSTDGYTAMVKLLETFGTTKVLSRPRISAVNNQEAKVLIGTREAYITSTQSQSESTTITSESVQFIDVGVKLNLIPTINKEGFITLKVKPEVSSVTDTITTEAGSRIPIVSTSEAETVVKVKDGTTVMIAGLVEDSVRDDTTGIPVLASIPFIGAIFGSKANQKKRTELIIFLTPHLFVGDEDVQMPIVKEFVPADMVYMDLERKLIDKKISEIGQKKEDAPEVIVEYPQIIPSENQITGKIKGIKRMD